MLPTCIQEATGSHYLKSRLGTAQSLRANIVIAFKKKATTTSIHKLYNLILTNYTDDRLQVSCGTGNFVKGTTKRTSIF